MAPDRPLQHVRVLVAHRDARLRAAIREVLEGVGAEVLESAARHDAAERVRAERPQVVLLDHALDAAPSGARGLVRDVAGDPELLGVAVVLMQPAADVEAVCAALADGAVDVWTTPDATPELIARVRVAYRSRQLLDFALRRYSDLEDLAYRDELTELPNRRGTVRQLDVLLSRARRHGHQLAVLLIDADRFKTINDAHGHAVGDLVLRELAARLRERVRREDLVGRWGGEEFLIALPETTPSGAAAVAESLRTGVSNTPIHANLTLTISIGIAAWTGQTPDALISTADHALYAAKSSGRNRVILQPTARAA